MAQTYPFEVPSGASITPDVSGTNDLGSTSLYFNNVYSNNLFCNNVTITGNLNLSTISGNSIFQSGVQVIDTITSSGVGTSLYNTKVNNTAYLNSITGVGTVVITGPTNGLITLSGTCGGYTIPVQALTSSPADSVNNFFGMQPAAPTTTAGQRKCYIRRPGTITRAEIYSYAGTAGSNESWSVYLRLNNTTDTLIATNAVSASERLWSNAALSIAVVSGDYFEIKSINPLWGTNPLTLIYGGYVFIQE